MTSIAVSRRSRVSGSVTISAGSRGMLAGQWKLRSAMVEACRFPGGGGVALSAIMVEIALDVIRVFDRREFVLMTSITGSWCAGVSSRVAEITRYRGVGAGQRECCGVVVEACRFPSGSDVALGAIVVEIVLDVIGVLDCREFILMATVAGSRRAGVAGGVTRNACHRNMRPRQSKGSRVVIKMNRFPSSRAVALSAIVIEVAPDVIRILY